nr:helix-turn-helix domain-containing protein [uncultured Psychroserpens sp.]
MQEYSLEFDIVKSAITFLILLGLFSLFIFRSFRYKNKYVFPIFIASIIALLNSHFIIFSELSIPNFTPFISLLLGPFVLFYVTKSVKDRDRNFKKDCYHFLPAILSLIISVGTIFGLKGFDYLIGFTVLHFGVYLFWSIHILVSKKVVVLRESNLKNNLSEKWSTVFNILLAISFVYITVLIETVHTNFRMQYRFTFIVLVLASLYLLARNVFISIIRTYAFKREQKSLQNFKKYKDSILSKDDSKLLAEKLEELMKVNKYYLNDTLSLKSLAVELKTHPKKISQVINENFKKNFFDYINSYRIEDAKLKLADNAYEAYKIYEIMYEVGFNSRSSFNVAFKKNTGITAKQYRERNLYN